MSVEDWDRNFAWYEKNEGTEAAAGSEIAVQLRRADKVLRLLDAAKLKVETKE